METYWDVPPAAVPMSSDHTAEAQGIWLPPASVGTEMAYVPIGAVLACIRIGFAGVYAPAGADRRLGVSHSI